MIFGIFHGWGFPPMVMDGRRATKDTSADGGRFARIDRMIDSDAPGTQNPQNAKVGQAGIAPTVNCAWGAPNKMDKDKE